MAAYNQLMTWIIREISLSQK